MARKRLSGNVRAGVGADPEILYFRGENSMDLNVEIGDNKLTVCKKNYLTTQLKNTTITQIEMSSGFSPVLWET